MNIKPHVFLFVFLLVLTTPASAQYPHYFSYNNENGFPSNEVYSLTQDKKGFIWFGCDAGLFKFDGVRYTSYKTQTQNSKSITGLTLSSSGKLYCHNFQSQVFCLDNDTLKEFTNAYSGITGITADKTGNIFVTHVNGISQYSEGSMQWTNYSGFSADKTAGSPQVNSKNEVCFLASAGVGVLSNGKMRIDSSGYFNPVGTFLMEITGDEHFFFSRHQTIIYAKKNGEIVNLKNSKLFQVLQNRKVAYTVFLPDGYLWVCTYKGIIKYNPQTDETSLLYPEISFSNAMIDYEGNYWFTTLQNGMMRVPDLNYIVWNRENGLLLNDKITKITSDSTSVYFANLTGTIGKLNVFTNELQTFHTGQNADVQSLDYDFTEKRLYFNINNLYYLQEDVVQEKGLDTKAIKSIRKIGDDYFVLTSLGVYIRGEQNYILNDVWARELRYDVTNNIVWIATNKGILKCEQKNQKWTVTRTYLPDTQILSIDFDATSQNVFALTFNGQLVKLNALSEADVIGELTGDVQGNKLKHYDNKIYIASNKGCWIFDVMNAKWDHLNTLSGLASDNVQDLHVLYNCLWLATGKGLQKIPLNSFSEKTLAKIYLKNQVDSELQLNYDQGLKLFPEVSHYSSNGQFEYAYRLNKNEQWTKLPASIEQIEIQNLPTGDFELELKAIDYLGRDSGNTIVLKGFVIAPFYKTWWFLLIVIMSVLAVSLFSTKRIIANIRRREQEKTQLANSQLTALKAQMNPHFIFNVLNSIKGYIYENDKEKATDYLDDFSDLIRKVLETSEVQYSHLEDELKTIKLYIELEGMMLADGFSYDLVIDQAIDQQMKIPSMIIQPYVENAFKHGLRHKKGIKKLTVSITPLDETGIEIIITDNGIGREQATKINSESNYKTAAFATSAIEKRVMLINAQGRLQMEIKTIDFNNAQNTGTQVIIQLKNRAKGWEHQNNLSTAQ